jgi:hypothetical protein
MMAKPEHAVSRYMSFAPALTPEAARDLLTIAHFDGTARVQTVDANVRRSRRIGRAGRPSQLCWLRAGLQRPHRALAVSAWR